MMEKDGMVEKDGCGISPLMTLETRVCSAGSAWAGVKGAVIT